MLHRALKSHRGNRLGGLAEDMRRELVDEQTSSKRRILRKCSPSGRAAGSCSSYQATITSAYTRIKMSAISCLHIIRDTLTAAQIVDPYADAVRQYTACPIWKTVSRGVV